MNGFSSDDLIDDAIDYLMSAKRVDVESVDINTFNHDDGTSNLSISITYPSEDIEEMSFYDGEGNEVVDIIRPEVSE